MLVSSIQPYTDTPPHDEGRREPLCGGAAAHLGVEAVQGVRGCDGTDLEAARGGGAALQNARRLGSVARRVPGRAVRSRQAGRCAPPHGPTVARHWTASFPPRAFRRRANGLAAGDRIEIAEDRVGPISRRAESGREFVPTGRAEARKELSQALSPDGAVVCDLSGARRPGTEQHPRPSCPTSRDPTRRGDADQEAPDWPLKPFRRPNGSRHHNLQAGPLLSPRRTPLPEATGLSPPQQRDLRPGRALTSSLRSKPKAS